MTRELDLAWAEINALGAPGSAVTSPEMRSYCAAIDDALAVIERLGGRDPLLLRSPATRAEKRQHTVTGPLTTPDEAA